MAEPLDSVFHLALKGNFGHKCSWMRLHWLFTKENFPFYFSDYRDPGVVLKPHFASLKRVRSS